MPSPPSPTPSLCSLPLSHPSLPPPSLSSLFAPDTTSLFVINNVSVSTRQDYLSISMEQHRCWTRYTTVYKQGEHYIIRELKSLKMDHKRSVCVSKYMCTVHASRPYRCTYTQVLQSRSSYYVVAILRILLWLHLSKAVDWRWRKWLLLAEVSSWGRISCGHRLIWLLVGEPLL